MCARVFLISLAANKLPCRIESVWPSMPFISQDSIGCLLVHSTWGLFWKTTTTATLEILLFPSRYLPTYAHLCSSGVFVAMDIMTNHATLPSNRASRNKQQHSTRTITHALWRDTWSRQHVHHIGGHSIESFGTCTRLCTRLSTSHTFPEPLKSPTQSLTCIPQDFILGSFSCSKIYALNRLGDQRSREGKSDENVVS